MTKTFGQKIGDALGGEWPRKAEDFEEASRSQKEAEAIAPELSRLLQELGGVSLSDEQFSFLRDEYHDLAAQYKNVARPEAIRALNQKEVEVVGRRIIKASERINESPQPGREELDALLAMYSQLIHDYINLAGPEKAREFRALHPDFLRSSVEWQRVLAKRNQWFPGEYVQNKFGEHESSG